MAREAVAGALDRIVALLVRKRNLTEEIRLMTANQSALLVPEKTEELLAVAEKKQCLIDEAGRIDAAVSKLEEDIKSAAGAAEQEKTFEERLERAGELRREIVFILQETRRFDERNRRKINEEYRKLRDEMQSLRAGKGLVKAYQAPAGRSGGCFIDKKK